MRAINFYGANGSQTKFDESLCFGARLNLSPNPLVALVGGDVCSLLKVAVRSDDRRAKTLRSHCERRLSHAN